MGQLEPRKFGISQEINPEIISDPIGPTPVWVTIERW